MNTKKKEGKGMKLRLKPGQQFILNDGTIVTSGQHDKAITVFIKTTNTRRGVKNEGNKEQ